jgi:hypothetical protein
VAALFGIASEVEKSHVEAIDEAAENRSAQ